MATYVETRTLPLAQLKPFPGNARRGDVAAIAESLKTSGQFRPLVVRDHDGGFTILAGHHTADAMRTLDWSEARCEVIQCTDSEATRINLADNRTSELGDWDDKALAALLMDLDDYTGTGYNDNDVAALIEAAYEPAVFAPASPAVSVEGGGLEPRQAAEYGLAGEYVHQAVPATGAAYAETQQEEAARAERIGAYQPRISAGLVEMILVYPVEDRDEVARLIASARETLGADLKGSEIVLRALRTMVAVLDNRHTSTPISLAQIAKHAGWSDGSDA